MKHFYKFTLPVHVLAVVGTILAIQQSSLTFLVSAVVLWIGLSIGVEVGIHRLFAHKSFRTSRRMESLLMMLGTLAGQGSIIFWVAVHRGYHHPKADTPEDPHSPVNGAWRSYMGWLIDDTQKHISLRSASDLMRDQRQMLLHRGYYWFIASFCVWAFYFSPWIFLGYCLASTICIQQNLLVNYLCHSKHGYRTYETNDLSRNSSFFGLNLLSWGLSLHNNHHGDPGSYTFAHSSYEWDPSAWVIRRIGTELREPRNA